MALSNTISVSITGNASSLQNSLAVAKESVKNFADSSDKSTNKFSSGFAAKMGVIAGVAQSAFSQVTSIISNSVSSAISRVDTLNQFPKVMSNMGISAEASSTAINLMSDKLQGLPTTLDAAASAVQKFTSANGDVKLSTDYFLALNNALLAGGQSTEIQSTALEQLSQAYAKGKPDMMEWRSLQTAMPAQLRQLAEAMGYGADGVAALGEDLREGKLSMDDFMGEIVRLNNEGSGNFASFEDQARASTGGIQTAITVMQSRITQGLSAMVDAIGSENIAAAATFIGNTLRSLGVILGSLISIISENKVALEVLAVAIIGVGAAFVVGSVIDRFSTFCGLLKMTSALAPASANGFEIMTIAMGKTGGMMGTLGGFLSRVQINTQTVTGAFRTFGNVLKAHPIITIISVIAAAAGALGIFGTQTEAGRQMFEKLGNTVKNVIANLPSIISGIAGTLSNVFSSIGSSLSSIFQSIITNLPSILSSIVDLMIQAFTSLGTVLPQLIETLATGGFAESIGKFGDVASEKISGSITNITAAIVSVITSITEFISSHSEQITSVISSVVQAVSNFLATNLPMILEAVVAIIMQLVNVMVEMLPVIMESISTILTSLMELLSENAPTIINAILEILMAIVNMIIENLPTIINVVVTIFQVLVGTIINNLPTIIQAAIQIIMALVQGLLDNLPAIIQATIQLILALVNAIIQNLPAIITAAIQIIMAIAQALIQNLPQILAAVVQIIFAIVTGLIGAIPQLIGAGIDLILGLIQGFGQMIGNVGSAIGEIGDNILSGIGDFFGGMADAGMDLIRGLIDGITNAAGWVWDKIQEICGGVLDGIKSFFGIESPSKVMKQMGKYLMQGFGMGIENNAKVAVSAATQAAVGISDAFASNLVTEPAELKVNAQSGLQATQNAFNGTSGVYGSTASYITEAGATNNTTNSNQTVNFNFSGDIKVEGTGNADTDAVAIVKAIQREFRSQGVQPLISNAGALR